MTKFCSCQNQQWDLLFSLSPGFFMGRSLVLHGLITWKSLEFRFQVNSSESRFKLLLRRYLLNTSLYAQRVHNFDILIILRCTNMIKLLPIQHFNPVLRFIYKPVICLALQKTWLVPMWNAKLSRNGLTSFCFSVLVKSLFIDILWGIYDQLLFRKKCQWVHPLFPNR